MSCTLKGKITPLNASIKGALSGGSHLSAHITLGAEPHQFEGSYDYTPSEEAQTISIEGMLATEDITIQPIPSNYGLITWNGSVLNIS